LKWKIDVGTGHSSPLVVGGKIYQFSRQEGNEVLRCIELDSGRLLWKRSYPAPYEMNSAARSHGKGPKSTPVLTGDKIIIFGISGILSSYSIDDGELIWQRQFADHYSKTSPLYGVAMSAAVEQDSLFVHLGGHNDGAFAAIKLETGEILWQWEGDGPGYASPVLVNIAGTRQLVTQSQELIIGLDASSGDLLWKIPFKTAYHQNSVTPAVRDGVLFFSGVNNGLFAVRLENNKDRWVTKTVWKSDEISLYMSSPVIIGDWMFGFSHRRSGQFFCLDIRDGRTLWVSEGRKGENAAVLTDKENLFFLTDDAELTLAEVTDQGFKSLRQYSVAESPTWAHPVILNSGVLIKSETSLIMWSF
jgi:outer membrane protein assembly factor BamB